MAKSDQLLFLACIICMLYCNINAKKVDSDGLKTIRKQIRDTIYSDMRLLGGLIRLSFHDCVGNGCDGCINTRNQDNAGLKTYIDLMEPLYQSITSSGVELSRADFWAMAGTEAVYVGADNVRRPRGCRSCPPNPVPDIKFYIGRKDCSGSPWTTEMHELPSAHWKNGKVLNYFKRTFGFSARETTAIMGAHTIGTTHPSASGFHQPWVVRRNNLDNQYYQHILDKSVGWHQTTTGTGRPVSGFRPRGPPQQQHMWISDSNQNPQTMMLNSDMALIMDLGNMTTMGKVSCVYGKCPDATSNTLQWTKDFADDNELFISEFSQAFQKMTKNGYTNLKVVPSS